MTSLSRIAFVTNSVCHDYLTTRYGRSRCNDPTYRLELRSYGLMNVPTTITMSHSVESLVESLYLESPLRVGLRRRDRGTIERVRIRRFTLSANRR